MPLAEGLVDQAVLSSNLRQANDEADRGWEETANQLALMEQKLDRVSYERDELSEIAQWRSKETWGAAEDDRPVTAWD